MKVELKFDSNGFRQILLSQEVKSLVEEKATEIQQRANSSAPEGSEGFVVNTMYGNYGGGRWVAHVQAADYMAAEAEAEDKILTGAIG